MAVAGGAQQSCLVELRDGRVHDSAHMARQGSVLVDADEAIAALRRGERVALRMLGTNLARVREAFE